MHPLFSIIIPCYNQGHFLKDALNSISECKHDLYEILIVNDGSTSSDTIEALNQLEKEGYIVIHQENKGLTGARNTGIEHARGEYLVMLDADNKIVGDYLTLAKDIFEKHPQVGVIYSDAYFFGSKSGIWEVGEFNLQRLMHGNYIDAMAIVRRTVVEKYGNYDMSLVIGLEDWELWLRYAFAGVEFYYLKKPMFYYRIVQNSVSKTFLRNYASRNKAEMYIESKFSKFMGRDWTTKYYTHRFKASPLRFILKIFLAAYFPSTYNRLISENKMIRGL